MKINNFKKVIKSISIFLFILLLNLNLSFAQDNAKVATQNFKETADNLTNNVLTSAGTLLMTAAFVVFFYGVVIFIYQRAMGKDGNDLKKGKEFMVWGLIALFVMVSVWGIIKLAQGLLDVESNEIKIQPVKFAALDTSGSGSTGGGTNVLKNPSGSGTGGGDFSGTKKVGDSCKVLSGTQSECSSGMYCLGVGGSSLKVGDTSGTCQTISPLLTKYSSLISLAKQLVIENSSKKVTVYDGVLYIQGDLASKADYDKLWNLYGSLDPNYKSGDVVLSATYGNSNTTIKALSTSPYAKTDDYPILKINMSDGNDNHIKQIIGVLISKKCLPSTYNQNSIQFTSTVETAVKNLQTVNNLAVDGVVGGATWEVILTNPGSQTKYLSPNITVKYCQ